MRWDHYTVRWIFQSTHPSRGATTSLPIRQVVTINFNPRTPHGVRPLDYNSIAGHFVDFNPRTPHGVRPTASDDGLWYTLISIHTPLTGCDRRGGPGGHHPADFNPHTPHGVRQKGLTTAPADGNFNPRTPHGVRLPFLQVLSLTLRFQPTHPSRGATLMLAHQLIADAISTHAPLTGCDGLPNRRTGHHC